ncbi:hypothetical protein [Massilia sp. Dwa41.01b]|uniref:hypothetical protein n=1 Tax=Massilia sp. Dwa41.01b TaxID=2709302 RepID=UPI001E566E19|nr:hypothetical protein [Massilia sp. Dwa41.01b]
MRIFGSESVVVVDAAGAIVSEAASERRLHRDAARPTGSAPSRRTTASGRPCRRKPPSMPPWPPPVGAPATWHRRARNC